MKKVIGLLLIIVLAVTGVWYYFSPAQQLQRLGYSREAAKTLTATLDPEALTELRAREYSIEYVDLLTATDFRVENYANYLKALDRNELSVVEIVQLVNHPDYDENLTYSTELLAILLHEYYISANRERYFAYYDEYRAPIDQVIANVNANRDREFYTETAPTNLDDGTLMLVNKYFYLSENYNPDLVPLGATYGAAGIEIAREAKTSFVNLFDAALTAGFRLYATSGYRDYAGQAEVYRTWVATVGEDEAKNYAALPGYSEHQTGLVLDIFVMGETTNTFAQHPAAAWLAEHAAEYGFILRYTAEHEALTGYDYEAWHFRYVGQAAATEITNAHLTLEEYVALKHAGRL